MPTNPNMVAIQTVTVGSGGASSIEFTSIPQTYTDLVVQVSGRTDRTVDTDSMKIEVNNSTTSYTWLYLLGNNSVASSSTAQRAYVNSDYNTANTFGSAQIYIPNYTSSNNKSFSIETISENNATSGAQTELLAQLWSNTAAITSIKLSPQFGTNWKQYSTATLYGITSAGYGAKATGGIITSDANYYYHTFLASGTFTPTQSITADCLVVAGGGGGGASDGGKGGGGGGAGGYQYLTSQSLTAQAYTVTIGAGGNGGSTAPSNGSNGSNSVFGSTTSTGGGGGAWGTSNNSTTGNSGGSGGGAGASNSSTGGAGTSGQGYAGGDTSNNSAGAGGGGAGAVGQTVSGSTGGNGGVGVSNSISGVATYYAGGGGGAGSPKGTGGLGGGGNGGTVDSTNDSTTGTVNTGGGGGGAGASSGGSGGGKAGGSGIVIVRYAK